jgi:hypothetical protein
VFTFIGSGDAINIQAFSSGTTVEDHLVHGNVIRDVNSRAIAVTDANANVHIKDNLIIGPAANDTIQIYNSSKACHVVGNHFAGVNQNALIRYDTVQSGTPLIAFNTQAGSSGERKIRTAVTAVIIGNIFRGLVLFADNCRIGLNDFVTLYEGSSVTGTTYLFNEFSGTTTIDGSNQSFYHNTGIISENASTETQSGDGSTTTFTIPHGLDFTPTIRNVWPESADAAGDFYISNATASAIEITYASAPPSGTDNLTWGFEARANA